MDRVRFVPNERIDLPDMEASAGSLLVFDDQMRSNRSLWLPSGRAVGSAATSGRILSGFGLTVGTPASTATVVRGTGIFPYLDGSIIKFGQVVADDGPASSVIDVSSTGDGTYAVYVRGVFGAGSYENRVFWNPSGAPAAEFVDNVATRDEATWEVTIQDSTAPAPGNGEWVKIYEITVVSNLITASDDYRHFYYEGDVKGSYAEEWGDGADDRDADRTLAPVTDDHRMTQLVRRQLTDIIGASSGHWGSAIPLSLTDLDIEHDSGLHTHVRVTGLPGSHPSISGWRGLILDASTHTEPVAYSQMLGAIKDGWGARPYVRETSGRMAEPTRFYDDFTEYGRHWTSAATTPSKYAGNVTGTGLITILGGIDGQGGVVELACAAGDTSELEGPNKGFVVDTDNDRLRFAARVKLVTTDIASVVARVGLYSASWRFQFELDNSTHSDNYWYAESTEFSASPTMFTASSDVWVLMYLFQIDATKIGYAIWEEGAPAASDYGWFTVPSMSAATDELEPRARLEVAGGGAASDLRMDFWEVWGGEAKGMGTD